MRATLAAVTGALALSVVVVPAAHAGDEPSTASVARTAESFAANGPLDTVIGDTEISNVVVNGGKEVVLGTTTRKTFTVSFTATDDSGIDWAQAILWHGPDFDNLDGGAVADSGDGRSVCTEVSATTSTCTSSYTVKANTDLVNALAGGWKVWALAQGTDGDYVQQDNVKGFKIQRASKLTVNAAPEPVKKDKTITITGKLTRANWETEKYAGYTDQAVKLQFKKKGTTTYTDVKTVKSGSGGALKTTVKAAQDGYFRYVFAGTSTTPAVKATGDFIDVQ